jgi:hypothetical protein
MQWQMQSWDARVAAKEEENHASKSIKTSDY